MCFVSYSDVMIPLLPTSVTERHASGADDSRVSMENEQLRGKIDLPRSSIRILAFRSSAKRSNTVGCWNFILSSNGSSTICLCLRERETMRACTNRSFQSSLHDMQEDGRGQQYPQLVPICPWKREGRVWESSLSLARSFSLAVHAYTHRLHCCWLGPPTSHLQLVLAPSTACVPTFVFLNQ